MSLKSVADAAREFGISYKSMQSHISRGVLECTKTGERLFFTPTQLDKAVEFYLHSPRVRSRNRLNINKTYSQPELVEEDVLEQDNPDFWAHFAKIKNWPNSDAPNTLRIWMFAWYEILDETTVRYIKSHSEPAKRRKALEDHCKNNNLSPATEEEMSRQLDGHEGDKLRTMGWTIRWEGDQIWLIEPPKSNVDWQQKPLMAEYCDVAISAENALFLEEIGLLPTYALADYCDILRLQRKRNEEQS